MSPPRIRRAVLGVSAAIAAVLGGGILNPGRGIDAGGVASASTAAGASGLAYSTASNELVQHQPRPGSCHAIGSGRFSRPDARCTPGALDPHVTEATIGRTICREGWTSTMRPPEAVTEPEKRASMAAYGDRGPLSGYEYDHLVPLELGGATNDPRNLWPEPGASPNTKDELELILNERVCDGQMTLADAQRAIAGNWVASWGAVKPKPAERREAGFGAA